MRIVGGFGSAGAGNAKSTPTYRVGRMPVSVARKAGIDADKHDQRLAKVEDPTADELRSSMEQGYCWWCNATHSVDGREITSWAAHYSKAHGITSRMARDLLGVDMKGSPFITEALRTKMVARAKTPEARVNQAKARKVSHARTGKKRSKLTKAGRESLVRKGKKRMRHLWDNEREHMMEIKARTVYPHARADPTRPCVVCGTRFKCNAASPGKGTKTCSRKCSQILYDRRKKVSDMDIRRMRKMAGMGYRDSKVLGVQFGMSARQVRKVLAGKSRAKVRGEYTTCRKA